MILKYEIGLAVTFFLPGVKMGEWLVQVIMRFA